MKNSKLNLTYNVNSVNDYIDSINKIQKNKIKLIQDLYNRIYQPNQTTQYTESLKAELQSYKYLKNTDKNIKNLKTEQTRDIIAKAKNEGAGCFFRLYYRGVSDLTYEDISAIYRNGSNSVKEFIIQNKVLAECSSGLTSDNVENLIKLQHYGCPTQLLDITESPLVALYFACINNRNSDGIINIYTVADRRLKFKDDEIIRRIVHLSTLGREIEVIRHILESESKEKTLKKLNETIGNHNELYNEDIFDSYFFIPPKNNARIIKQSGAFIINGLFSNKQEAAKSVEKYKIASIIVPHKSKNKILKELAILGINEVNLFPDLENVINWYKKDLNTIIK